MEFGLVLDSWSLGLLNNKLKNMENKCCENCSSLTMPYKCYDTSSGKCISCKNNYSCEKLYGSNNKPPINPLNNFCSE